MLRKAGGRAARVTQDANDEESRQIPEKAQRLCRNAIPQLRDKGPETFIFVSRDSNHYKDEPDQRSNRVLFVLQYKLATAGPFHHPHPSLFKQLNEGTLRPSQSRTSGSVKGQWSVCNGPSTVGTSSFIARLPMSCRMARFEGG